MPRVLDVDWDDGFEKVHEGLGLVPVGKVEVDAVPLLLDVDGVPVRLVLEDQLFQQEKRALVRHLLPHLHGGTPHVGRVRLGAVAALLVGDDVNHLEALLHQDAVGDGVLDCDLDFDAARVGFCPDEAGVDNADLAQVA